MKHTRNRLLALLLVLAMAIGMVPFGVLAVGAESLTAPTIEVAEDGAIGNLTWTAGYIGSSYHSTNAWRETATSWNDSYRLSSVVTVPKAGTTLVWTESAAAGAMSKNAFFLTSWKDADGTWAIDLSGVNLIADGKNSTDNQVYDEAADTMTYIYTTTRDNETLRFGAYAKGAAADACPTVYAYAPTFADGTVSGIKWLSGYVGSFANGNGYQNKIKQLDSVYTYSAPLIVPKAGTTVTFTDSTAGYCSPAAYAISTWTVADDGRLDLFYGCSGNNTANANEAWIKVTEDGYVYSYTTTYDNEIIRLCYRDDGEDAPVVTYIEDNAANCRPILEAAGYDPDNAGKPYMLTGWYSGAIHTLSNEFAFSGSDYDYRVTDIIPVVGKGTTVTFTDTVSAAGAALEGNFIGSNLYAIASFLGGAYDGTNSNDINKVDTSLANVIGDATASVENGKCVYSYTTTKDVEFLRLSLSVIGNFVDEENRTGFVAPIIYMSAPDAGTYFEELEGLHLYTIGDSYLEGNGVDRNDHWVTQLGARYDMTYVNYGINGNAISSYGDKNAMVNRYQNMVTDPDADVIIFEGGRNDYNKSTPIGSVGDPDPKTFLGAVQLVIDGLLQKYPNAMILCMTPWDLTEMTTGANALNKAGKRSQDYTKAFTDYVEMLDNDRVRLMNNIDPSVVPAHMTDAFFRAAYCQTKTDISHFNAAGMDLVFPWLSAVIAEQYKDYASDVNETGASFYVNGVTYSLATTDADVTIRVPDAPVSLIGKILGWAGTLNGEKIAVYEGQTLNLAKGDVAILEPMTLNMALAGKPGVRFEQSSTGLRFLTSVSLSDYANLTDLLDGTDQSVSFGTLIVPNQYVIDMKGELTHASLDAAEKQRLDIGCNIAGGTDWYKSDDANGLGYIAGSIAAIKIQNYSKAFTAAGYAKTTFEDGTVRYVYAAGSGRIAATVYDVAYIAMNDRAEEYSGVYQYQDAYGTYTPYTTQQLEVLEGFLDPVVSLKSVSSTTIITNGTKYYTPTGFTMTTVDEDDELFDVLANVCGDDELTVIYVIETTDGTELADGTYGGLLLDGYECTPIYYEGKILIGCSDYSAYY